MVEVDDQSITLALVTLPPLMDQQFPPTGTIILFASWVWGSFCMSVAGLVTNVKKGISEISFRSLNILQYNK